MVSGFATGIRICSCSVFSLLSSNCISSCRAKRLAERSVTSELMTHVKRIMTTVPLSTSSFSNRSPFSIMISCPINTAASVAAACALLKPNIMLRSLANHLLRVANTVITTATFRASPPVNRVRTSIIIPTPIRKYGINKAFPTNSNRFIKGETCGIKRFNTSPARKAPKIPSTLSSYLRKNHRPIRGKKKTIRKLRNATFTTNSTQNIPSTVPLYIPPMTARIIKANVTVTAVPPMVIFTLLSLDNP